MEAQIIYNAIRCPDGTLLESKHRHDYNEHTQEDGRIYAVDGGLDYSRRAFSDNEYEELLVTTEDGIETIREIFKWTSVLDENGERLEQPVRRKLKDLDDQHVLNLIEWTREDYPKW